jgi:glycosyltransferase involved in cell wall biosynthesis
MRTLQSADGLHCDCHRDLRLAQLWGWNPAKASAVLPGAGGIQAKLFTPPADPQARSQPVVINPRGFRAYVRNDTFFKAAALVLAHNPKVRFVCPNMANERQAQRWLAHLDLEQAVRLLPKQTRPQMAAWFQQAQVAVSPSIHDGTPNTLLEAMACGCYPIAGDLEPLREWITPGENGDLINPGDPQALAQAIVHALDDPAQREKAAHINRQLVVDRAEYGQVMARAQEFYRRLHFAG